MALTIIGASGFASKGVFAKLLYADGWSTDAVLTVRSFLALPLVAAWALWMVGAKRLIDVRPQVVIGAMIAGALCYYFGALLDFQALQLIHASVERVLLFSYPSIIVVLYSFIYRQRPETHVLVALALTYSGILMVVTGLDLTVLKSNLAGASLVLATAVTSALYYLASDRWTPGAGSITFTLYALASATLCMIVHAALLPASHTIVWNSQGVALMAGLATFGTAIPMLAMGEGVRRLGAPRASIVSTVGPPITIVLGNWLLAEHLTPPQWIGVALIVAGILNLELGKPKQSHGSAIVRSALDGSPHDQDR
jgi:drug/metabolite transporter (DMT)-like permease